MTGVELLDVPNAPGMRCLVQTKQQTHTTSFLLNLFQTSMFSKNEMIFQCYFLKVLIRHIINEKYWDYILVLLIYRNQYDRTCLLKVLSFYLL